MAGLSISRAWEETRQILGREGRLIASVALALIALPTAITALITPAGSVATSSPFILDILVLVSSLAALAGQLALMRLALGPSITVGGAIAHGMRRMPVYLVSALIIVVFLFLLAVVAAALLIALGVPMDSQNLPATPSTVVVLFLLIAVVFFAAVRMLMSGPVATAEPAGPVAILRRTWALTAGHFAKLLGFIIVFFVGAIVVLIAVQTIAGIVARLALGPIEPMSASALLVALCGAVTNAAVTALFAVMLARIYAQLVAGEAEVSVPKSGT